MSPPCLHIEMMMSKVVLIAAAVGFSPLGTRTSQLLLHLITTLIIVKLQNTQVHLHVLLNYTKLLYRIPGLGCVHVQDHSMASTRYPREAVHLTGKLLSFFPREPGPRKQITVWPPKPVIFMRELPQIIASSTFLLPPSGPFHPDSM